MKARTFCQTLTATCVTAAMLAMSAHSSAATEGWKSFKLYGYNGDARSETSFDAIAKPQKKYKLCAMIPHLKDSYWVAVDYGLTQEAKRLGASINIYEAGGYDNLPKQISQFDDCLASNPDAILVAPISESGLGPKMMQAMKKGIPVISFVNPVVDTPITSKIFVNFSDKGYMTGQYLKTLLGPKGGLVGVFPGPQGSGWAEGFLEGFNKAIANSNVKSTNPKFGDAGLSIQTRLVEDTIQSNPGLTAIWGTATAAEGAVGAIAEAGMPKTIIVGHSEDQAVLKYLAQKKIAAAGIEYPVMQARVAVDLAVKALQKQPVLAHYAVIPFVLTPQNITTIDMTQEAAPDGFQPVFSVN
ncbi:TMAO reductase system periplasmic protein TorT [Paraburkholderia tropica]|uniref:TMAO reductase system periplasmic protein TorT n=1 Tax=Paraburkholderia tropica TaxID=92647 RepID=UPI0007EDD1A8|nr:TMAO reductase system periplasmic protein TorT [Paraburkholderia tropica]